MSGLESKRTWHWTTWLRLLLAGWRPSRNVLNRLTLPASLRIFPEAERILAEFGNLRFGDENDKVALEPSFGQEILEETRRYEAKLGRRLYPLGMWEHQDRVYPLLDENRVVYTLSFGMRRRRRCHYELRPYSASFERAVEYLVRRYQSPRQREEDLGPSGLLGKVWRLEDSDTGESRPDPKGPGPEAEGERA